MPPVIITGSLHFFPPSDVVLANIWKELLPPPEYWAWKTIMSEKPMFMMFGAMGLNMVFVLKLKSSKSSHLVPFFVSEDLEYTRLNFDLFARVAKTMKFPFPRAWILAPTRGSSCSSSGYSVNVFP